MWLALAFTPLSRRAAATAASTAAAAIAFAPFASHAANFIVTPAARVTKYPGLEYLEPIYELKLSLDALAPVAKDPSRYPALKKRLDAFFSGGPLSEKFYYAGLSIQYIDKITYDDLDDFVRTDKQQRAQAMEDTLQSLEACKNALGAKEPDAGMIANTALAARDGIARWLLLVPSEDLARVEQLFLAVRKADTNRNGKLESDELAALAPEDRTTWEARLALVGP